MVKKSDAEKDKVTEFTSFDANMQCAQSYVEKIEQGNLSLEELISCYENGMVAVQSCKKQLELAKQKITEIEQKQS